MNGEVCKRLDAIWKIRCWIIERNLIFGGDQQNDVSYLSRVFTWSLHEARFSGAIYHIQVLVCSFLWPHLNKHRSETLIHNSAVIYMWSNYNYIEV